MFGQGRTCKVSSGSLDEPFIHQRMVAIWEAQGAISEAQAEGIRTPFNDSNKGEEGFAENAKWRLVILLTMHPGL
jgi:hypothetical protein